MLSDVQRCLNTLQIWYIMQQFEHHRTPLKHQHRSKMKQIKLNTKSLHFNLAKLGNFTIPEETDWGYKRSTNICTYISAVIRGTVLMAFLTCAFIFFANAFVDTLFGIIFSLYFQTNLLHPLATILLGVVLAAIIFTGLFFLGSKIFDVIVRRKNQAKIRRASEYSEEQADSFLLATYIKFRYKYCVDVDFIGAEEK